MFAENMDSISALNTDIAKLNHAPTRPMLNRHMIKDASRSSHESIISKDSQPYEDDIQSLQSKTHLVKGIGSVTVQKTRQNKVGHT